MVGPHSRNAVPAQTRDKCLKNSQIKDRPKPKISTNQRSQHKAQQLFKPSRTKKQAKGQQIIVNNKAAMQA